jgi:hypothetical protein
MMASAGEIVIIKDISLLMVVLMEVVHSGTIIPNKQMVLIEITV